MTCDYLEYGEAIDSIALLSMITDVIQLSKDFREGSNDPTRPVGQVRAGDAAVTWSLANTELKIHLTYFLLFFRELAKILTF